MPKATYRKSKGKVKVLITPVYLFDTEERSGLLPNDIINDGNEVEMYYVAIERMAQLMRRIPRYVKTKINLVVNNYQDYAEKDLYTVFSVLKDVLLVYSNVKFHFFDETCAKEENII